MFFLANISSQIFETVSVHLAGASPSEDLKKSATSSFDFVQKMSNFFLLIYHPLGELSGRLVREEEL